MKNINVMLKPASSLCNMGCRYCFYADVSQNREQYSYGIMSDETADNILKNLFSAINKGDKMSISFQGGEPTLAGLKFFENFVSLADTLSKGKRAELIWSLQTNGLLIDEQWCVFLKKHNFLVGLSIDINAGLHDANRIDNAGKGTYARVMSTKHILEKYGVEYNVLSVLSAEMARHPTQVWSFIMKENIEYLQLIPCLGKLDDNENSGAVLTPKRFAEFYKQLFTLWSDAYSKGKYRSIKLFDDLVSLLALGTKNACGITGECDAQIVIESDGSVYPCDFYAIDQYRLGNLAEQSLEEILKSPARSRFLTRAHVQPELCNLCEYMSLCGGGCKRLQREVCCTAGDSYCGYKDFLDCCLAPLQKIAYEIRQKYIR